MAETTLFISGGTKTEPPLVKYVDEAALEKNQVVPIKPNQRRAQAMVSCGRAWGDGKLAIAHPENLTECGPDQVGEIWFSGSGVGEGYWQNPDKTEATFKAYFQDTGAGPFLRTGDLGFLQDGNLFITGRLHDVLSFWGLNHYPHHIEETVERCHPGFRHNSGAAFSIEVNGDDRLVIAQEVERTYRRSLTVKEVTEMIRWRVFEDHFVDVYAIVLLKPGGLPKTPSGKVQRSACRTQYLESSLSILDEWRSREDISSDIPTVMRRYLNPITHLRRYGASVVRKLRHWIKQNT